MTMSEPPIKSPSLNGPSDRDAKGRFLRGNRGGPGGNRLARKVAALRLTLLSAVTKADIRAIAQRLVAQAKIGDLKAIAELFDRTLGRPIEADFLEIVAALEQRLAGLEDQR